MFLKLQKVLMEGLKNRANTMLTPPAQISKANCRNGFAPCSLCHYYSRACSTAITLTILLIASTVPLIFPIFLLTAISHDLLRFTYISLVKFLSLYLSTFCLSSQVNYSNFLLFTKWQEINTQKIHILCKNETHKIEKINLFWLLSRWLLLCDRF